MRSLSVSMAIASSKKRESEPGTQRCFPLPSLTPRSPGHWQCSARVWELPGARGEHRGAGAGGFWGCFFAPHPPWVRLPGAVGMPLAQRRAPRGCVGTGSEGSGGVKQIPGWFSACIQQLKIICEHPVARGSPAVGSGRAPPFPVTSVLRDPAGRGNAFAQKSWI